MARASVLIVDSDSQLTQIVGAYLNLCGYRVHGATRGRDALTKLALQKYGLILIEPKLRDDLGEEVIRAARNPNGFNAKTPILVATAAQQFEFPVDLVPEIAGIISKPFRLADLDAALEKIG